MNDFTSRENSSGLEIDEMAVVPLESNKGGKDIEAVNRGVFG